jgi:hypothetical protein
MRVSAHDGNIWFCKLLLLFKISTIKDAGIKQLDCAYVSVLEEYNGPRKSGHILHILHILHVTTSHVLLFTYWVDKCQSAIVYELHEQSQVLYIIPVSSILGQLPLVYVVGPERFPLKREENRRAFPGLSVIKPRTGVTVVDGGM